MFYGSPNALWGARLIIDNNVQCFLEAVQLIIRHFKLGENSAPQKKNSIILIPPRSKDHN